MKKYLLSSLALAAVMAFTTAASAGSQYGVANAGMGFGRSENGNSGIFGVGYGYEFNKYLRSDIIVDYRGWDKVDYKGEKKSDTWSVPVLWNVYGTMPVHEKMGVYGMAGLGTSYNKSHNTGNARADSKFDFAWNVGAGVEYMVSKCMALDLGYRYTDLGDGEVKPNAGYTGKKSTSLTSHDVKLTARYMF